MSSMPIPGLPDMSGNIVKGARAEPTTQPNLATPARTGCTSLEAQRFQLEAEVARIAGVGQYFDNLEQIRAKWLGRA
jgi:hypothetical protein